MMSLGNTEIEKAYLGGTKISKIYLGEDLVFGESPTPILPYDAQVEYLQSNGSQYIDSGVECKSDLSVKFKFMVSSNSNSAICGGITSISGGYFRHHCSPYNSNFYWLQSNNRSTSSIIFSYAVNTWNEVDIDATNGTYTINNTSGIFPIIGTLQTTGKNFGIFARIGGGSMAIQYRACKFSYFQILREGTLLRDFIPVRKNGVGYMYDRISGELFGNSGTGSFAYGNDVTT